jgi:hypothetical protein
MLPAVFGLIGVIVGGLLNAAVTAWLARRDDVASGRAAARLVDLELREAAAILVVNQGANRLSQGDSSIRRPCGHHVAAMCSRLGMRASSTARADVNHVSHSRSSKRRVKRADKDALAGPEGTGLLSGRGVEVQVVDDKRQPRHIRTGPKLHRSALRAFVCVDPGTIGCLVRSSPPYERATALRSYAAAHHPSRSSPVSGENRCGWMGVVGSMTHCEVYRAAAVAWAREVRAPGHRCGPNDPCLQRPPTDRHGCRGRGVAADDARRRNGPCPLRILVPGDRIGARTLTSFTRSWSCTGTHMLTAVVVLQ